MRRPAPGGFAISPLRQRRTPSTMLAQGTPWQSVLQARETMAMNVLMAALSVQLALYGAAWVAIAYSFHLYPPVSMRWAAGWMLSALGTALLTWHPEWVGPMRELLVNLAIIAAFLLLHHGLTLFLHIPWQQHWAVLAIGVVVAIEMLHWVAGDTQVLRTWIFTLAALLALGPMLHDLLRVLPRKFKVPWPMAAMTALPVALSMLAFVVRATAITYSDRTGVAALDVGSSFDLVITLAFLVFLGMFNFSLYNLVLGALIRRLEDLAATDQLTGLNNRRVAMERLDEEHARFQRSGQRYALIMMDLDHFKSINDQHGHGGGDAVLREVARRLLKSVRSTDTLARVGGEEFLLLLPMNDIDGALVHAGRIRKHVGTNPVHTPSADVPVTVSLGVADVLDDDASAQSVVSRADAALYRAKAAGRNRVEAAPRVALPQAV